MTERTFVKTSLIPSPQAEAFAWHERPGAFERLSPPWDATKVLKFGGIRNGERVVLRVWAPWPRRWVAEHEAFIAGQQFVDRQVKGPFAAWLHTHRFEAADATSTRMTDDIRFTPPLGPLGSVAYHLFMREQIERMFAHRHRIVAQDLADHYQMAGAGKLTVAITGASGTLGSALRHFLTTGGHTVRTVERLDSPTFDLDPVKGADVVVHLAGAPLFRRWNQKVKDELYRSRVDRTRWICEQLAAMPQRERPRTLLSGSAVGIYGDQGDTPLTESFSTPGGAPLPVSAENPNPPQPNHSFLARLAADWEAATRPAEDAGVRVAHLRTGIVLTPQGGALRMMLPIFKLGLGGQLSDGSAWFPWIHVDDHIRAMYRLICDDSLVGPFNLSAPNPVTNADFTRTLAKVLRRPAVLRVPAKAMRLAVGDLADQAILVSQRVLPQRLEQAGFSFRHPDLEGALRTLLGR